MKLNIADQDRIYKFYKDAFDRYGMDDVRSVQWTSSFGQKKRFDVLLNVDNVRSHSILDVGCGLGELYKHLKEKGVEVDYTGIDLIPEFIESARSLFPEANFEHKDVFEINKKYDFVLASGALSFKVKDNDAYYRNMIRKMYDIANKAVAFNMLDNSTHVDNETYAAYSPKDIVEFCSSFATRIEVMTNYLPQDFTVYLYK